LLKYWWGFFHTKVVLKHENKTYPYLFFRFTLFNLRTESLKKAFLNNMNFTTNNQIINFLNRNMRMQNFKLMKTLVVLAALLLSTTIGYAQKKSKEEKTTSNDEAQYTQQSMYFKKNEVYSMLIPLEIYSKFKDRLGNADKLVVMARGENMLSVTITNISTEILTDLRSALASYDVTERVFFTEILPYVMISGDDGLDIPAYLNSLTEFYKINPEVVLFAPKTYKEFPSQLNIGRFFTSQRELGHVTKF